MSGCLRVGTLASRMAIAGPSGSSTEIIVNQTPFSKHLRKRMWSPWNPVALNRSAVASRWRPVSHVHVTRVARMPTAANIKTSVDQKAIQTFDLWVKDVATLNVVMKQIGRIKGVLIVERLRT